MSQNEQLPPLGPEKPMTLDYEADTDLVYRRPPWWVFGIGGIYFLMLSVVLLFPLLGFMAGGSDSTTIALVLFAHAGLLLLLGASLMWIPVQRVRRRPVKRRSILIPLAGSSVLIGALVVVGGYAIVDAIGPNPDPTSMPAWNLPGTNSMIFGAAMSVWFAWVVFFGWLSYSVSPETLGSRIYQGLIVGSVLELLVAVPAHLIARKRPECCAGMASGYAIGVGVAIAIIVLGPGVFLLFFRRWRTTYGKQSN